MNVFHKRLILVVAILVMAGLACNAPVNRSSIPPTTAPLADEDAQQLEEQLQATLSVTGDTTITITQDELNAYLSKAVAEQEEPILSNPSIILTRSGQMEVYGTVTQSGLSLDTVMVLQPRIEADGTPYMEVVSFTIGPFPAPESLQDQAEARINEILRDYLAGEQSSMRVSSIVITEGQMTVAGVNQP